MTIKNDEESKIHLITDKSTDDRKNVILSRVIDTTTFPTTSSPNTKQVCPDKYKNICTLKNEKLYDIEPVTELNGRDDLSLYHVHGELASFQAYMVAHSPALKHVLANFLILSCHDGHLDRQYVDDFEHLALVFKCTSTRLLAFKRSFSYCSHFGLAQHYIKKSRSFEKFLANVLNGKKKSENLQHQQASNNLPPSNVDEPLPTSNFSLSSISIKNSSSSSSSSRLDLTPFDQKVQPIGDEDIEKGVGEELNRKAQKTRWPLLKIEDSIRESSNDLNKTLEINKNVNTLINNLGK